MTKATALTAALMMFLLTIAGALATPVKAIAANAVVPYDVPSGPIFNVPAGAGGTPAQQFIWHDTVTKMIDASPPGATITIALYSWSYQPTADALLRADARGVIIKVIMFDLRLNSITNSFAKALNDGKPGGSYFKVCKGACLGVPTTGGRGLGLHHVKLLTFSGIVTSTGSARYVSTVGTGNLSLSNGDTSQNAWQVVRDNKTLYDGLVAYAARMKPDKDGRTATAKVVASGVNKYYLYPQLRYTPDLVLDTLNATTCTAQPGFGNAKRRTVIRISVYTWTSGRLPIAKRIAALQKAGCDIGVIVNNDVNLLGRDVLSAMLRAGVRVLDGHTPGVMHTHAKTLVISGTVKGKGTNRILTGTPNYTRGSIYANDEILHQITGSVITQTYLTQWNTWSASARPILSSLSAQASNDPRLREE